MNKYRTKYLWLIVWVILFCICRSGDVLAQTVNRSLKTGIYPVVDKEGVKVDVGMDYIEALGETIFVDTGAVVAVEEMESVEMSVGKYQYAFIIGLKPSGVSKIHRWIRERKKENFVLVLDGETYYLPGIKKTIDQDRVVVKNVEKFQLAGMTDIGNRLAREIIPGKEQQDRLTYEIERLDKALVQKDSITLKEILSDNLVFGHSNTLKENKRDLIAHLYNGYLNYSNITRGAIEMRFSEDIAVVTRDINVAGALQGTNFDIKLNVMETWILNGAWRLLCRQSVKRQ